MKYLSTILAAALFAQPIHAQETRPGRGELPFKDQKKAVRTYRSESGTKYQIQLEKVEGKDISKLAIPLEQSQDLKEDSTVVSVRVQTEGCADCVVSEYFVTQSKDPFYASSELTPYIKALIADNLESKKETAVAESSEKTESRGTSRKSKEDPKYDELACKGEVAGSIEQTLCISENISEIKEMKDDKGNPNRSKYTKLYTKAKKIMDEQLPDQLLEVYGTDDLDEARERFDELKSAAGNYNNRTLDAKIRSFERSFEGYTSHGVRYPGLIQIKSDTQIAIEKYDEAVATENMAMEYAARTQVTRLMPQAERLIEGLTRQSDNSSLSFFNNYFSEAGQAMGITFNQNSSDILNSSNPRLSRGGGFTSNYQDGQPYSFDINMLLQNSNNVNRQYNDGNSILNSEAADYLNGRSSGRGRS